MHGRLHRLDMQHQDMQRHHELTEKAIAEGRAPPAAFAAADDSRDEGMDEAPAPAPVENCESNVTVVHSHSGLTEKPGSLFPIAIWGLCFVA